MTSNHDVVVIGGGFAGVTTARELGARGYDVAVLEARERLGGRTWTTEFAGKTVEFGGTWVHWLQPYVWTELTRYGIPVVESPQATRCGWVTRNGVTEGSPDEFYAKAEKVMDAALGDSRELFERPYDPLFNPAIAGVDDLSVEQRLESLALSDEERDLISGVTASWCSAPNKEAGLTVALHWYALSGWDALMTLDCAARYKIEGGTQRLMECMSSQAAARFELRTAVDAVEQSQDGVTVSTRQGRRYSARLAVVTVPLNVLESISFRPALSEGKSAAASEHQASRGAKVWARLRGELEHFFYQAPDDHPLTWLGSEFHVDGHTLVVGFGPDANLVDPTDREAIAKAIRRFIPDAVVEEVGGHNWVTDEYSRGTWPVFRPGQLTRRLSDLQRPEDRLILAGSESANGWNGFIDGAIESGLRAARQAHALLDHDQTMTRPERPTSRRDGRPQGVSNIASVTQLGGSRS